MASYCANPFTYQRRVSREVKVGHVGIGGENIKARIHRPDVSFRIIRLGRAIGSAQIRGRIQNFFAAGIKVSAGRAAFAIRYHANIRAIHVHGEYLIAFQIVTRRLKDQLLVIRREVSLGILAAKRKLADIAEMFFFLRARGRCTLRRVLLSDSEARENEEKN